MAVAAINWPRKPPVLARRLALVDQLPDLLEQLLRDESGDQAADDAAGGEEQARHGPQYCSECRADSNPHAPKGRGV